MWYGIFQVVEVNSGITGKFRLKYGRMAGSKNRYGMSHGKANIRIVAHDKPTKFKICQS